MMKTRSQPDIVGTEAVLSWFGEWPTFHDAEVLELRLDREGVSWLKIHAWLTTKETYEKEGKQYFRTDRHAVVTFQFDEILDLQLADFSAQNVIFGLEVERTERAHRLVLHPCYGLGGFIEARGVSVEVQPGSPDDLKSGKT